MTQFKYPLGREGALYVGTPEDAITAMDEVTNARDVSYSGETEQIEQNARASGQFEQNRPNLKTLNIEFDLRYEPGDPQFEFLRDAWLANDLIEAAPLHLPHDTTGSEGPKGRFFVSGFTGNQNLREGQRIPVTLELFEFDEWYENSGV